MGKEKLVKNGLVVFDQPIKIEGHDVYGVLYNQENERVNRERGNLLSHYIGYLYGVSRLYNAGGYIHSKTRDWKIPEYNLTGKGERKLHLFIALLMDGLLSYKTYEFDTPIQAQDNEVDEDNDEIVINRSLIDRYVKDTQSL